MTNFKQFFNEGCGLRHSDEERELPYDPEAIKRAEASVKFPEIIISEQELEDTIDDPEKLLPNGKSLLKRFTLAIVNVDGTYTLKQVPDHTMLAAENAERAGNTLELGGKEWDVTTLQSSSSHVTSITAIITNIKNQILQCLLCKLRSGVPRTSILRNGQ